MRTHSSTTRIGKVVRAGIERGVFVAPPTSVGRATHAAIAAGVISELPAFTDAESTTSLQFARNSVLHWHGSAAVVEMSIDISTTVYDDAFPADLQDVYLAKVAPALTEIREAMQANSVARRLMSRTPIATTISAAGTLAVGTTTLGGVPALLGRLATMAGSAVLSAAWDRHVESTRIAQHRLYFLHRSNELLERS